MRSEADWAPIERPIERGSRSVRLSDWAGAPKSQSPRSIGSPSRRGPIGEAIERDTQAAATAAATALPPALQGAAQTTAKEEMHSRRGRA